MNWKKRAKNQWMNEQIQIMRIHGTQFEISNQNRIFKWFAHNLWIFIHVNHKPNGSLRFAFRLKRRHSPFILIFQILFQFKQTSDQNINDCNLYMQIRLLIMLLAQTQKPHNILMICWNVYGISRDKNSINNKCHCCVMIP